MITLTIINLLKLPFETGMSHHAKATYGSLAVSGCGFRYGNSAPCFAASHFPSLHVGADPQGGIFTPVDMYRYIFFFFFLFVHSFFPVFRGTPIHPPDKSGGILYPSTPRYKMEKDELSRDTLKNSVEVGKNNLNDVKENAIMQMSRRKFLQLAGATAAALALGRLPGFDMMPTAAAFYQSPGLSKFTQPLRSVGPGAIPVAVPDKNISWDNGNISAPHYTIDINQYQDTLYPELGPTTLWGYNPRNALGVTGIPPQKHLGGIIVAERGIPIQITFQNNLPNKHILPVDPTIMGVEDNHVNRTAVHLHGGMVPWISDGGPFSWFDNAGNYGESVSKNGSPNIYKVMNPALKPG